MAPGAVPLIELVRDDGAVAMIQQHPTTAAALFEIHV